MCFDPIDFNDLMMLICNLACQTNGGKFSNLSDWHTCSKHLQGAAMDIPASSGEHSANMAEIEIPLVGLNVQALAVPETWSA